MNKKGLTQVEMVISFVIFMLFLIFLFVILRPQFQQSDKGYLLDSVKENIKEETQGIIILSSLRIDTNNPGCITLNALYDLPVIVKDSQGTQVPAGVSGDVLKIQSSDTFFTISYSEGLEEQTTSSGSCQSLSENEYTIGATKSFSFVSLYNVTQLKNEYTNNYNAVREKVGIPEDNDFGFKIQTSNRVDIEGMEAKREGNVGGQVEVYADSFAIEYIDLEDGQNKPGWIVVTIW